MLLGFSCFLGREFVVLDFVVRLSNLISTVVVVPICQTRIENTYSYVCISVFKKKIKLWR